MVVSGLALASYSAVGPSLEPGAGSAFGADEGGGAVVVVGPVGFAGGGAALGGGGAAGRWSLPGKLCLLPRARATSSSKKSSLMELVSL